MVEEFFTSPVERVYRNSLGAYLEAFKSLLTFTYENFEGINSKKSSLLRNYDAYYMKYRGAVDRYNLLYLRRFELQKNLLKEHPGLGQYLPEVMGTNFLKAWD